MDIEKFIGENLINKIGIAITVIGVGIGAKYSIEHDMISPLTRIILGYLAGIGLMGFGIKLKKNYENYSAVLVSGAIAIMYFITYSAYSFYELIPQMFAFALMVIFTSFTVVAAINYNKQIIAHIGLVGAYAVPFLLSNGSGKVEILFSYMAIINIGIIVLSFKKYWKPLYYVSFGLTWLIFLAWYFKQYSQSDHFTIALSFLAIFFLIFYLTFMAYKLVRREKYDAGDIVLLFLNSFIFYGVGYAILNENNTGEQLLGLFTLGNAVIHFIVSALIYRLKLADRNLLYLVSSLVLVFITIAIPVQLDGNWVTLLWAGEAALMFWIGRTKDISIYEKMAYPLMFLAFISLIQDWGLAYNNFNPEFQETRITPILNINFLSSALFLLAFGFINYINSSKKYNSSFDAKNSFAKIISVAIPAIFIFTLYNSFRLEIECYWNQLFKDSIISTESGAISRNYDIRRFRDIWIINYTLFFVSALTLVNLKKIKSHILGYLNIALSIFVMLIFLGQGLYLLSELRVSYLSQGLAEYYEIGTFNIIIRYISIAFAALPLITAYMYLRENNFNKTIKLGYDLLLHISILWIASSELIHWMDMAESTQSYKLGLSILWGVYSFLLIAFGIWKNKKHLRIGAIALFGVTLIKLFLYDISHLNTISKTIVFVSLGILLLIISFLYNKYKSNISDEDKS